MTYDSTQGNFLFLHFPFLLFLFSRPPPGLKSVPSGLETALSGLKSALLGLKSALSGLKIDRKPSLERLQSFHCTLLGASPNYSNQAGYTAIQSRKVGQEQ